MPTILSRFDMIFIVKDEHEQSKDMVSYFYTHQKKMMMLMMMMMMMLLTLVMVAMMIPCFCNSP